MNLTLYAYDAIFFSIFTLVVVLFLYRNRSNLQRQGIMYLYRTKVGINFIEWTSKKFKTFLTAIQPIVIASGYILMAGGIYLIAKVSYIYLTSPIAAKALKVPVIFPLIPYLPELFHIDFLPPFPFTYWILIIAIIAVSHEFAHGVFARINKIKIHSTGFGFLGPFLAAFVEPDEKQMEKKGKRAQLSVLAAGTFANIIMTVLFGIIMWLFFISAFSPAGLQFNTYATAAVPLANLSIQGVPLQSMNTIINASDDSLINVQSPLGNFSTSQSAIAYSIQNNLSYIVAYEHSPAFNANLTGAITSIGDSKVNSYDSLRSALTSHSPGDNVTIKTINTDTKEVTDYNITLGDNNGTAYLGIGIIPSQGTGVLGWIYNLIAKIKDPAIYYISSLGNFGTFIYNFLWWTVLINLSVALVNMLPIGIFDGGRFFYITIEKITGSKKIAQQSFKILTWAFLALIAILIAKWIMIYI